MAFFKESSRSIWWLLGGGALAVGSALVCTAIYENRESKKRRQLSAEIIHPDIVSVSTSNTIIVTTEAVGPAKTERGTVDRHVVSSPPVVPAISVVKPESTAAPAIELTLPVLLPPSVEIQPQVTALETTIAVIGPPPLPTLTSDTLQLSAAADVIVAETPSSSESAPIEKDDAVVLGVTASEVEVLAPIGTLPLTTQTSAGITEETTTVTDNSTPTVECGTQTVSLNPTIILQPKLPAPTLCSECWNTIDTPPADTTELDHCKEVIRTLKAELLVAQKSAKAGERHRKESKSLTRLVETLKGLLSNLRTRAEQAYKLLASESMERRKLSRRTLVLEEQNTRLKIQLRKYEMEYELAPWGSAEFRGPQ